jgi:poly-gamma-glutamate synthesis protein (capsule biosynthesis protein)
MFKYIRPLLILVQLRSFTAILLLSLVPLVCSAQKVTIVAVGDICLANGVQRAMEEKGRGYPFQELKSILRGADIAFGNLECCLSTGGMPVPKKYNFRGHPRGALALSEAGFDVISLANNHSLDYGKSALADTVRLLSHEGIRSVGGGETLTDAHKPRILCVRGVRVAFLAYLGLFPSTLPLHHGEPGIAMADLGSIRHDVRAAAKKAEFVIVSLHAGQEYTFEHDLHQEEMAHAAVDAGAAMVIGHHPHVVQDSEIYKGRPIFYSLGNFVFNPSITFLREPDRPWSGMVLATLERGKPVRARLVSLAINERQPGFRNAGDALAVQTELGLVGAVSDPQGLQRRMSFSPAVKIHTR